MFTLDPKTFNYCDNKSTNASAESFNAKIKACRSQFRGVGDINFFLLKLKNYLPSPQVLVLIPKNDRRKTKNDRRKNETARRNKKTSETEAPEVRNLYLVILVLF